MAEKMTFDFQTYIAAHRPTGAPRVVLQNYAFIEDMKHIRDLSKIPLLPQMMEKGLQAWRYTEKRRLQRNSRDISLEPRSARVWQEVCLSLGEPIHEARLMPEQKLFFEPYGDGKETFFGLSLAASQLPVTSLRFIFGQGIGALANGHVPYLTLMRFVDHLTRGFSEWATEFADALLHWQRYAVITRDRAGLLASHDMSAAIFIIMRSLLDWSDDEIMLEIRRYHSGQETDFGEKEIRTRIHALQIFEKSTLYAESCGYPTTGTLSMSEVDEAVIPLIARF
jgi:hypothetical protein